MTTSEDAIYILEGCCIQQESEMSSKDVLSTTMQQVNQPRTASRAINGSS